MFQSHSGAFASTASGDDFSSRPKSSPHNESVRHLLYGSPQAIQIVIKTLHRLGYAEPNEWSRPMPTVGLPGRSPYRPNEVMCILTKTVQIE
ncbi:MAG: hypothetical protein WBA57_27070 [Elainellaceae cyanobacterium]